MKKLCHLLTTSVPIPTYCLPTGGSTNTLLAAGEEFVDKMAHVLRGSSWLAPKQELQQQAADVDMESSGRRVPTLYDVAV